MATKLQHWIIRVHVLVPQSLNKLAVMIHRPGDEGPSKLYRGID